ncbi:hypothetical protein BFL35_10190 [Clavibacter michiganensis]|nr:hypothetical protein BFL35_10190 [Clavibacter michiganensis]
MPGPGDLADPLHVPHDVGQRRARALARTPRGDGLHALVVARIHALRHGQHQRLVVPLGHRGRHELRHERRHADAVVRGQRLEHVVGHVARHVALRPRARVAEQHGPAGDPQRVAHHVGRYVREVDDHADPLHLGDHALARGAQPVQHGRVGRGVGPRHVRVVRERHVPDAERAHRPERAERAADRVAALHAEERGDAARRDRAVHVVGRDAEREPVRVRGDEAAHHVDLLDGGAHRVDARQVRHPHRPELRRHASALQTRQVGVQARHGVVDGEAREHVVGDGRARPALPHRALAERPGEVVVAVDYSLRVEDPGHAVGEGGGVGRVRHPRISVRCRRPRAARWPPARRPSAPGHRPRPRSAPAAPRSRRR